MDQSEVDDQQREAALSYLAAEHARGAFDAAELQRRTADVRASQTVAQLLAATAEPAVASVSATSSAVQENRLALVAGVLVVAVLVAVILSRLS